MENHAGDHKNTKQVQQKGGPFYVKGIFSFSDLYDEQKNIYFTLIV